MPHNRSQPEVEAFLQRAFRSRPGRKSIFSRREFRGLIRMLSDKEDPDSVEVVVREFRAALSQGRLVTDPMRRERIHNLFDRLHHDNRLPHTLQPPAEGSDWVDALLAGSDEENDPRVEAHLPAGSLTLSGQALLLDDTLVDLRHDVATLLAMTRLPTATLAPFGGVLAPVLADLDIPVNGPGKLTAAASALLLCTLLTRCAPLTDASLLDRLAEHALTEPRPALAVALQDVLARAGRSPAPTDDIDGRAVLGHLGTLLSPTPAWDSPPFQVALEPAHVATLLGGLAFCARGKAASTYLGQLVSFAVAREGQTTVVLDAAEHEALSVALSAYIEDSSTAVFQFGKWPKAAAMAIGQLTHRLAVEPWAGAKGSLYKEPARLGPITLAEDQRSWALTAIGLVRDQQAAGQFHAALLYAHEAVPSVDGVLTPSAQALFERVWNTHAARVDASADGRLDLIDLPDEVIEAFEPIADQVERLLTGLTADQPIFALQGNDPITVDRPLAATLLTVMRERVGSDRSLPNVHRALTVFAVDDTLEGAPARAFETFLQGYLDTWPALQTFDFNKLERLAAAQVTKHTTPLCQINGRAIDPGVFHAEVGRSVKTALQPISFAFDWIPHRFGYRAKQAIELVDLLAERAMQGMGPIATLLESFEGATVHAIATTSDMEYNALIFRVWTAEDTQIFYLDSTGQLHEHARHPEHKHVLFEAEVDHRGHVHVRHPKRLTLSPRAYPLMNTYGLGDRIDVESFDEDVEERLVAKERFETRYKVRQATIVGFTDQGQHQIAYEEDGVAVEQTVTYDQIRSWNNPHLVHTNGGRACGVHFNEHTDPRLATELIHLTAIAAKHDLPEFDMGLSESQLARVQKAFLRDLNAHTQVAVRYPRTPAVDDADAAYHANLSTGTHDSGEYLTIARGVCRHQFVHEHIGKQLAGIDERFASGAANTYEGDFRGRHIWGEVSLADRSRLAMDNPEPTDARYLSDATWHDPYIPLWDGAYGNDLRRIEMYDRTNYYAYLLVKDDVSNLV